ncbi:unnamed protein product, partial [Callosobruchus maculatus]
SVFLAVNATKCFDCVTKEPRRDKCVQPQDPKTSDYFDCGQLTPVSGDKYVCGRLEYQRDGRTMVTRACLIEITCEALEKISQIELTNCTICDTDFCNGA